MYFNKKYQRTGALFEGPYKSVQIKDEARLLLPTRFLHQSLDGYCSYPEYLGLKETSWVKPNVVLAFFNKGAGDYKSKDSASSAYRDFVEKYKLDPKEKELLEGITFESEIEHLERRDPAKKEEVHLPDVESRSTFPVSIVISAAAFVVLVGLGIRNIKISEAKSFQPMPTPAVLAETEEAKPPKILTITSNDEATSVNIRQKPTIDSESIGKAKAGDTFEFVSEGSGWYEIKLVDGSTGFISATYVTMEETNNE